MRKNGGRGNKAKEVTRQEGRTKKDERGGREGRGGRGNKAKGVTRRKG